MERRNIGWHFVANYRKPQTRGDYQHALGDKSVFIPITSQTDWRRMRDWCDEVGEYRLDGIFATERVACHRRSMTRHRQAPVVEVLSGVVLSFPSVEDAVLCKITWT